MLSRVIDIIKEKVRFEALLTATPGEGRRQFERWELIQGSSQFLVDGYAENRLFLENTLRKVVEQHKMAALVLRATTHQYYPNGKAITEIWGFRLWLNDKKRISFENISHDDLYQAFSIDNQTGQEVIPEEEAVYCGPSGIICGWDMV